MPTFKLFKRLKRTNAKQLIVASVFTCALAASIGAGMALKGSTSAAINRECTNNSIDKAPYPGPGQCGAADPREFCADLNHNVPGDLKAIYPRYGLTSSECDRFIATARPGVAYKNGTIKVDNRVVATNVSSLGRNKNTHYKQTPVTINGTTYYESRSQDVFLSDSLPIMVMFDRTGSMEFAVMNGCGNPNRGDIVHPSYACKTLRNQKTGPNSYIFSTDTSAGNGATIAKVVYNYGDGTPEVVKTNPNDIVSHTFTKNSTVTVKVYVNLPGNQQIVIQSAGCAFHVTYTPPPAVYACELLTLTPGKVNEQTGDQDYTLNAKANVTNATINSYTFTFGDQQTKTVTSSATMVSVPHTYKPGDYTPRVSVHITTNTGLQKDVTSDKCVAHVSVPKPECKPNVPVGDNRCKPSTLTCVALTLTPGTIETNGNQAYTLAAQASADNATITSYVFAFGDNTPDVTVTTGATTASAPHTYAPSTSTASVTVFGKDASGNTIQATSANCAKELTVNQPECKPNVPVGSPECQAQPCTPGGTPAPESPECTPTHPPTPPTPPTELVNTGPGEVIGLFASVTIAGAVAHRLFMSRRALRS
jgi:hypothetical protein